MLRECSIGPSQLPIVSFGQFCKTPSRSRYKRFNAERQSNEALPTEVNYLFNVGKGRLTEYLT